jgi:ABC-type multidrug transport system fused ATPase/permease subunit
MQQLRLRRFAMSLATYAFVILATFLVTRLGFGRMSQTLWVLYIGLAVFGNSIFFVLFYTNVNLRFTDPSLTREQIVFSSLWGMIVLYCLPDARPIVLMFYLPSFSFGMLKLTRRQYFGVEALMLSLYAGVLVLEYFRYSRSFDIEYQVFLFVLFGLLLTWFAFFGGFVSNLRRKLRSQQEEIRTEMEERITAQAEKDKLIVDLKNALQEVKTLSGLLPICSSCKKIRDDQGYWNQIESYIQTRSDAEFSHSICPDCAKKLYPDIDI